MISAEQFDNWFTYHPPTEETAPRYAAIRAAEFGCHKAFAELEARAHPVTGGAVPLSAADCDTVNIVTRALAEAIDGNAPDSADKTAAIRCVRIARNAANECVMANVLGFPTHLNTMQEASRQLVLARWQANSAIACGGK